MLIKNLDFIFYSSIIFKKKMYILGYWYYLIVESKNLLFFFWCWSCFFLLCNYFVIRIFNKEIFYN